MENKLRFLNISVFLQTQLFLLPFLFLFYRHCGLTAGDFFLFQGIFSLTGLILEIPLGYLGDIFPKRNILILSYIFFIIRCLLWLLFSQYGWWILLIGEILFAAQKASFAGVSDSYIYEYLGYYHMPQKMKKRYGKFNFFLAFGTAFSSLTGAVLYAWVSEYTLQKYHYNYGFMFLIGMELILNVIATALLFFLPKLPRPSHPEITLKKMYKNSFHCILWIMKNNHIKYHILYSGLLAAITLVFAWSFQPIMKLLLFPATLYGVVYFINHTFRALGSLYSDKISCFISLPKMAECIFVLFILCFLFSFILLNIPNVPVGIGLLYFVFVSFTIGGQLAFRLLHSCRLHTFIPASMRATSSSISTMAGRLYAAFFFILMKILLDGVSISKSLLICFLIFIIAAFPLKKIWTAPPEEEEHV